MGWGETLIRWTGWGEGWRGVCGGVEVGVGCGVGRNTHQTDGVGCGWRGVCGYVEVGVGWGEILIRRTGWGAGGGVCVGVWRWVWGGVGETFIRRTDRRSENEMDCVAVSNGPFENRSISGLIADDVRKLFTCVARIVGAIWTFRLSKLKK